MGLDVVVLEDAVGGVEAQPGDSARAVEEMKEAGASFAASNEVAGRS